MGASAIPESVDFRASLVNVKTIAPKKSLYQSGHAIWYYGMPMAVYSFLEEYDFSGKIIIPFVTSGGSGFSDTISEIQSIQSDATVLSEGYKVTHSKVSDVTFEDVEEWINSLNK